MTLVIINGIVCVVGAIVGLLGGKATDLLHGDDRESEE